MNNFQTARTAGFTLVELLVAMGLFLVVLTIAFNAFSSSNKLVEADTGRVMASQNVQSALDILNADIRQAGEDLSLNIGVSGLTFDSATKTLSVRRGIAALNRVPVCAISGNNIQIVGPPVGSTVSTNACTYATPPTGTDPVNIVAWRSYFTALNGQPQMALLYRPASGSTPVKIDVVGITTVLSSSGTGSSYRVSVSLSGAPPSGYSGNGSLLVPIEQRQYKVVGSDLMLALNLQTATEAQAVAYGITDLSAVATLVNPPATVNSLAADGPWARIRSVDVTLTSGSAGQGTNKPRALTATVFPRNIEQARSAGTGTP
ncbi:prepilin-type N-terminal cleavage/methylation domain-containing protein [Deinococcus aquatilis]|uniref:prepilin-type N-terminal cleavage/methylation domain-containing protein n=1 Tax=Deinococcus aquatilis TaxID=519440 RepID=UPI00037DA61F|nr:prepilin-type N-terminal cleavage/methylation domain-containing protein [Deinococcus aquatilis]